MVNEWLRDMVNAKLKAEACALSRPQPRTSATDLMASGPLGRRLSSETLFADAEIAEDHIQDVFDVDATR